MPVTANWYDPEKTISHWQFVGEWTWEEFFPLLTASQNREIQKPYPTAVIMDFTAGNTKVGNIMGMFQGSEDQVTANIDIIVFVGSSLVAMLVATYKRLHSPLRYPVITARSMAEALTIIDTHRQQTDHPTPE